MVDNAFINGFVIGDVLNHTFTQMGGTPPVAWDNFQFVSFEPDIPGSTNPPMNATFDPDNQLFSWDSTGFTRGVYEWSVRATNDFGNSTGALTVRAVIPEPGTAALAALGLIGVVGIRRQRSPATCYDRP
jgi:hypothetical protein